MLAVFEKWNSENESRVIQKQEIFDAMTAYNQEILKEQWSFTDDNQRFWVDLEVVDRYFDAGEDDGDDEASEFGHSESPSATP